MRLLITAVTLIFLCGTLYSQQYDAELIERKTDILVDDNKLVTTEFSRILINKRAEE